MNMKKLSGMQLWWYRMKSWEVKKMVYWERHLISEPWSLTWLHTALWKIIEEREEENKWDRICQTKFVHLWNEKHASTENGFSPVRVEQLLTQILRLILCFPYLRAVWWQTHLQFSSPIKAMSFRAVQFFKVQAMGPVQHQLLGALPNMAHGEVKQLACYLKKLARNIVR